MPASHLGKPRLAGLHDFVQVLEGAVLDLNWLSFAPMHNPFDTKHSCLTNPNANPHRPHAGMAGEFRQAWGLLRGAAATTISCLDYLPRGHAGFFRPREIATA